VVELKGEEAEEFEQKAFSVGQLSDVGTDAIIPYDRDPDIVRYEEPEILTMRDIMNVVPTTSDTIRFVKHTLTERAAASQDGRGAAKNYLRVVFDTDTISVETIAVLSKVTEQDIDDAPRLIATINNEMRLDVKVEEERQILWGGGANGELEGIWSQGIPEFNRAVVDDTLIDTIRRMRTDLRKVRIVPTAVMIDPIDWESIELTKSTQDEHYIWGVITDLRGPRIWSMRVVESDAMTNLESGERRILMGDFVRGATLYDRHDVRLAIGFVDDDFARNLRTLRAEERLAVAVKRPYAFTYAVTAAGTGTYGTGS
jgi:HK97 family phage major capsid protein